MSPPGLCSRDCGILSEMSGHRLVKGPVLQRSAPYQTDVYASKLRLCVTSHRAKVIDDVDVAQNNQKMVRGKDAHRSQASILAQECGNT